MPLVLDGTTGFNLPSGAEIGVGTTAPAGNGLHVDHIAGATLRLTRLGTSTSHFVQLETDGAHGKLQSGGNFEIDVASNIILDSDSGTVQLKDNGTEYVQFFKNGNNVQMTNTISDGDIIFRGNDGGSMTNALTLDISNLGFAFFNANAFFNESASDVDFRIKSVNQTNMFYVDASTNRIGIGTDAPNKRLHIIGNSTDYPLSLDSTNTDYAMEFRRNGTSEWWLKASANSFQIHENGGGDYFTVASGGNVGIGTTSPATQLHIDEGTSNSYATIRLEGNNRGGDIEMYQGTLPVSTIRTDQSGNMFFKTSGAFGNSSVDTRLTILTAGNVGIGTDNPSAKLNVSDTTAGAYVRIDGASSGDIGSGVQIYKGSTVAASLYANPTHDSVLQSDNGLTFRAGGTNRMRISNTGNIGIGDNLTGTADLHVEKGTNNNTGHFKMGHTRQRRGYVGISSSQNRWYKIMNYSSGQIFSGVVQLFHNRGGGFNQTGAFRTYNASVGGYSNGIYGPMTPTGDSGESGAGTIEFGSDEAMYLRVNSSIYGGTIYFTFTGTGNGMDSDWQFNVNNYSTSLP